DRYPIKKHHVIHPEGISSRSQAIYQGTGAEPVPELIRYRDPSILNKTWIPDLRFASSGMTDVLEAGRIVK
ncbi:MAG: hypothetical protein PVF35_04600, partial [Gammaproteobacteria bacterium]